MSTVIKEAPNFDRHRLDPSPDIYRFRLDDPGVHNSRDFSVTTSDELWRLATAAIWHTNILDDGQFAVLGDALADIGHRANRGNFEDFDRRKEAEFIAMHSMYTTALDHRMDKRVAAFVSSIPISLEPAEATLAAS